MESKLEGNKNGSKAASQGITIVWGKMIDSDLQLSGGSRVEEKHMG